MASGSTSSEEGSTESSEEEDEEDESGSKVRLAHPVAAKLQYIHVANTVSCTVHTNACVQICSQYS